MDMTDTEMTAADSRGGSYRVDWAAEHSRPEASAPMRAMLPTGLIWPLQLGWKRACEKGHST